MITYEEVKEEAAKQIEMVKEDVASGNGPMPMFTLWTRKPPDEEEPPAPIYRLLIAAPFGDDHEKDLTAKFIRATAQRLDAVAVLFVADGWTAPDHPDTDRSIPASQRPDRREGVLAILEYERERTVFYQAVYSRDDAGKPVMGETESYAPDKYDGRMSRWLPDKDLRFS